jgi:transglutaminase-like putative cysteine protease
MKLHITHRTDYHYTSEIGHAISYLCLTPISTPHQSVQDWQVSGPGNLKAQLDAYGNPSHLLTWAHRPWQEQTQCFIRAQGRVETHAQAYLQETANDLHPLVYLRATELTYTDERLRSFAWEHLGAHPTPSLDDVLKLTRAVQNRVKYRPGRTDVQTTALEAFDWGWGVCQDQAHVMLAACRAAGLAARYVSGYFYAADEPELASHAWVDVCLDVNSRTWWSIDVTHACLMDERHVRLAVGPDYAACAPIRGVRTGGGEEDMRVSVDIHILP